MAASAGSLLGLPYIIVLLPAQHDLDPLDSPLIRAPFRRATPPSGVLVRTESRRTRFNCGAVPFSECLRALGRAWGWRRRMEAGAFATIQSWPRPLGLPNAMSAANFGWPISRLKS